MVRIKLADVDTRAPKSFHKEETKEKNSQLIAELDELQNVLYAESKHAVLVVLQGMDASGKDGAIRDVFGQLNPQGVEVHAFKVPTAEELSHDFLWRVHKQAPPKGIIQIFNRSHYEDILVTRVHNMIDDVTAKKRMRAINDFEKLLVEHNDTTILKFYLHVSDKEQDDRLKERVEDPRKQWKYNAKDLEEAKQKKKYIEMYEDCFEHCNDVPWTIVPADQNWYKIHIIAKAIHEKLTELKMKYPTIAK